MAVLVIVPHASKKRIESSCYIFSYWARWAWPMHLKRELKERIPLASLPDEFEGHASKKRIESPWVSRILAKLYTHMHLKRELKDLDDMRVVDFTGSVMHLKRELKGIDPCTGSYRWYHASKKRIESCYFLHNILRYFKYMHLKRELKGVSGCLSICILRTRSCI